MRLIHSKLLALPVAGLILCSCSDDVTGPGFEADPELVAEMPSLRYLWTRASLPVRGPDENGVQRNAFGPEDRAYQGWHRSIRTWRRGDVDPEAGEDAAKELRYTMEFRAVAKDPAGWAADEFGGIAFAMCERVILNSRGDRFEWVPAPADLTDARFLEFWIDDGTGYVDPTDPDALAAARPGRLHFDFGYINEDSWWNRDPQGDFLLGEFDDEDLDGNGRLSIAGDGETEDRGLDGLLREEESAVQALPGRPSRGAEDPAGDDYYVADETGEYIYVYINGTEGNERLDSEDGDRSGSFDLADGFFRLTLDLSDPDAYVDPAWIYRDDENFIRHLQDEGISWRQYRLDLRDARVVQRGVDLLDATPYSGTLPDLADVPWFRIWYEPRADGSDPVERRILLSGMHFRRNPRP